MAKQEILKEKTNIDGLDAMLNGGLPKGRTTVISGGPGCGKSLIALEFIYRGALEGIPGIFVTFEEKAEAIRQNAMTLGWDIAALEEQGKLFILEAIINPKTTIIGDFDLSSLKLVVEGKLQEMGSNRVVLDGIDVILYIFKNISKERDELLSLHSWLMDKKISTIMTIKTLMGHQTPMRYDFIDFMADCVIYLDQRVDNQLSIRRFRITKYRGSGFGRNEYPYVITDEGIKIIPVSSAGLKHKALGEHMSTGISVLDSMLGGGIRRASCVLIAGSSGAGKTTLTCQIINQFYKMHERILYIGFEESEEAIIENMKSPGIDLFSGIKENYLRFMTNLPEAMGVEEHLVAALSTINKFKPNHIVVDAISACIRMGSERAAFDYIIRLMNFCKERNITSILINQTTEGMNVQQLSGNEVSSMVDTSIFLGMIESGGEINRMVMVLKSRGSCHSNQYREFQITQNGIDIFDVYIGKGSVLTGIARKEQEAKEEAEKRLRFQELSKLENEIEHRRSALKSYIDSVEAEIILKEEVLKGMKLEEEMNDEIRKVKASLRGEDN
ncbi:MAG: circadian clock protein KaiC [Desulfobacterales bacterium]|nr:circadian clock protein KaiC [Desulfobacterales bacterium]